jgi:hypothetical protein
MFSTFTQKCRFSSSIVNSILFGKYFCFLLLFSFFSFNYASAQSVLVAGTDFTPTALVAGKTYYGITDVSQYGMITGSISVTPPFTPSANPNIFNGSPNYAITTNPANLDAVRYESLPAATDYMLIASSPTTTPANLLTYTVPGLVPGSNVTAVVTYCYVLSSAPYPTGCTSGDILSLRGVLNADANNTMNGLEGTQVHAGGCYTLTITQATSNSMVVPSNGIATFNLNFQQSGACKVVGVSKIEITGTPQPAITSSEGSDVCTGEQSILQMKQTYDVSSTYAWEYSTNGGGTWAAAPGTNNNAAYLLTAAASGTAYQYRAKVTYGGNTYTTSPITINSITCCTAGGSRQTVFYDDFGTLDLAADPTGKTYKVWDYTNPLNPVQVTKTTTTPFRWTLSSPPPGTTAALTEPGPVNDNQYIVAAGLTGYNPFNGYAGAQLQWAADIGGFTSQPDPGYDHSGNFSGAALLLNVPAHTQNQVIYSRTIPNLCGNKQVFFEAWINVFTSSASGTYFPVNIAVKLIDGSNAANFTTSSATATRQADGGGNWVEITGTLTLGAASNSLIVQLINNQDDPATGDDLVLDDIKVYACAPPSINLVFNTTTLAQTTTVCTSTMNLFSIFPSTLPTYYGTPNYLYQYSYTPSDYTSWHNIPGGGPATATSFAMTTPNANSIFTSVPTAGGNVYFRVIATTSAVFGTKGSPPFTGVGGAQNYASQSDVCQNYSVSDPISASVLCPLPVELVSFTAVKNGSVNQLSWMTASEKDNAYFLVEKSTNGTDFTEIGRVEGHGSHTGVELYSFQDRHLSDGIIYYRLKQVDINGEFNYSKIVALSNDALDLTIYPNPNDGSFFIQVNTPTESYKVEITDLQGKIIYTAAGSDVPENIKVANIAQGVYLLRLYMDNQVLTKKLMVY